MIILPPMMAMASVSGIGGGLFFVYTPIQSCPYFRATIGVRPRFARKYIGNILFMMLKETDGKTLNTY